MRRRFDRSENRQIRKVASLSAQALTNLSYGVACISQREKMSPRHIGDNLGSEQLRRLWRWFIFALLGSVILCLCVSLFVSKEAQAKTRHAGEPARTSEPVNDKASGGKDKSAPKDATPKDATPKDATPIDVAPTDSVGDTEPALVDSAPARVDSAPTPVDSAPAPVDSAPA